MKILFCLGSMDKGGSQRVISNLSNSLIKDNEVSIVTTSNRKSQYILDNEISQFFLDDTNHRCNNFKRINKLNKIIKKVNPDIIVTFQPEPSFRILLLKIFNKIPVILSVRNDPKEEYKNIKRKIFMKILYPLADGYVFQTEEAKEYFSLKIQRKSVVIPNPINEDFIVDKPYDGEREKTIVTIGRIEKQKNQKLLIDAFKEVLKTHGEYKLLIYGEGSLKGKLIKYVEENKMSNNVIFKGKTDNVKREIYKSGIFVLSSNYEGMPNALMEAMLLGVPCISTNCSCGGPRDLIENDENGILIEVNNVDQLIKAINKIIENRDYSKKISINAIKIQKKYDPVKIINLWKKYMIKTKDM